MNLPEPFLQKMRDMLGEEYSTFIDCFNKPAVQGLRCNRLKINPDTLSGLLPMPLAPVKWCREGFTFPSGEKPAKSPLYHAGLYYIQEPSAMSPVEILDVQPGDRVLDICAAPGGKAVQIAGRMRSFGLVGSCASCSPMQPGLLAANDISASRCKALVKNLELCGVTNAVVMSETPARLATRFGSYFDRILVDAPCSGEGMFRKDPDAVNGWNDNKLETCVIMQRELLYHAAAMLKPGGRMVYSTCTFEPAENEGMISDFLQKHPEFTIVPINHEQYGFSEAKPEWGDGNRLLRGAARLWPHKINGEGHFVCLMQKSFDELNIVLNTVQKQIGLSRNDKLLFKLFCDENLHEGFDKNGDFLLRDMALYLLPDGLPDLHGIRVARSGWYLGDVKTNRFEPSQALAMGLRKTDTKYTVDFQMGDERVIWYLKGESFALDEIYGIPEKKWVLVCVEGYPLGWGKMVNGNLKNKYPRGWEYAV